MGVANYEFRAGRSVGRQSRKEKSRSNFEQPSKLQASSEAGAPPVLLPILLLLPPKVPLLLPSVLDKPRDKSFCDVTDC